jgi:serine/threonine protein kinase
LIAFGWTLEVLKDRKYTEKADVWSFGMVLYELTTNTIPYSQCQTRTELIELISIQKKKPEIPKGSEIPPALRKVMKQCWKWKPEQRPSFLQITHILRSTMEKENAK